MSERIDDFEKNEFSFEIFSVFAKAEFCYDGKALTRKKWYSIVVLRFLRGKMGWIKRISKKKQQFFMNEVDNCRKKNEDEGGSFLVLRMELRWG